jgi:hypothetical protein
MACRLSCSARAATARFRASRLGLHQPGLAARVARTVAAALAVPGLAPRRQPVELGVVIRGCGSAANSPWYAANALDVSRTSTASGGPRASRWATPHPRLPEDSLGTAIPYGVMTSLATPAGCTSAPATTPRPTDGDRRLPPLLLVAGGAARGRVSTAVGCCSVAFGRWRRCGRGLRRGHRARPPRSRRTRAGVR